MKRYNIIYSLFVFLFLNSKIFYCDGSNEFSSSNIIIENSIDSNSNEYIEDIQCHRYESAYFIYDTFYIYINEILNNAQKIQINSCVEYNGGSNEFISINQFKKPNHYYITLSNNKDCSQPFVFDFLDCSNSFNLIQSNISNSYIESDGSLFKFLYGISNNEILTIEQTKQNIPRCSEVELKPDDLNVPFYIDQNSNQSEEINYIQ